MSDDIETVGLIVGFLALIIALAGVIYPAMENQGHRKWSWADEQTWTHHYFIPITETENWTKYSGNPILQGGDSGEWDYAHNTYPCVLKVNDTYFMYYAGCPSGASAQYEIGLATSTSPTENFTKYGKIISRGSLYSISCPYVIYDEYETNASKKWKMWYWVRPSGLENDVYLAYSPDGYSWTNYVANPVYESDLYVGPATMKVGRMYYMAYGDTSNQISLATSTNGINWTGRGTLISKGSTGDFDENAVRYNSVFWNLGVWYIPYAGKDASNVWRIGLALSNNGFVYRKYDLNPILGLSSEGWDSTSVLEPCLLMVENKFYMYYVGGTVGGLVGKIGVATIP